MPRKCRAQCSLFEGVNLPIFGHQRLTCLQCSIAYRETVELCQRAEKAGVSFISVHGRTKEQRNQPVNLEAIKLIKENVSVPVVANGDIKTLEQCEHIYEQTRVNGIANSFH